MWTSKTGAHLPLDVHIIFPSLSPFIQSTPLDLLFTQEKKSLGPTTRRPAKQKDWLEDQFEFQKEITLLKSEVKIKFILGRDPSQKDKKKKKKKTINRPYGGTSKGCSPRLGRPTPPSRSRSSSSISPPFPFF